MEKARGRVSQEELFWFRSEKIYDASTKGFGGVLHTVDCVAGLVQQGKHIMGSMLM